VQRMNQYVRLLLVLLPLALTVTGCGAGVSGPTASAAQAVSTATPRPMPTAAALPTQGATAQFGGAIYNGDVRAKAQVAIVPKVAGQVMAITVAVGDAVQAGDVLIEIEHDVLDIQVQQAEAGLAATQALVRQAQAGLAAAQANLRKAEEGPTASERQAAAAAFEAAQAAYDRLRAGPTQDDLIPLAAQLGQAEAVLKVAQAAYDKVKDMPMIGMLPQSLQLEQATLAYEATKATYAKAVKGATPDQLKAAEAQLAQARAANERAWEGTPAALLDVARAQVQQAEAAVAAANAQVKQGEAALALARLQRANATIKASISGRVAQLNTAVGALASPQSPQPLLVLVSPDVEVSFNVDVTARAGVTVGDAVQISVDAYPDRTFRGQVARVAPIVNPATRTVEVMAVPEDSAGLLLPGMFASVTLVAKE